MASCNDYERACMTGGRSEARIHELASTVLEGAGEHGETLVDVGCGKGTAWEYLRPSYARYIGVDLVEYDGFPADGSFVKANLNIAPIGLPDAVADLVLSIETIEHLENPRAFVRELTRLAKPGAPVIISTPNLLSFQSLVLLLRRGRYAYFQDADYPAHISPILEVDLERIATECGLAEVSFHYSMDGRNLLTRRPYPRSLAKTFPRACSDFVLLFGRKNAGA